MSNSDLVVLSQLLDEALDRGLEGDRAAVEQWLAALAPGVQHLAPRLRDMLLLSGQTTADFVTIGPKLTGPAPVDDSAAQVDQRIGPYRLIKLIGSGGMGAVWLAERIDGALKRQVALKLPYRTWGAGLAERMARERDIGAILEHPHIVRLYDAGVDAAGRPYLAFEFIDGKNLDTWCESETLGVHERVKLVVQVARAVAYAHARLVVHRDLKPSNVLVTDDGEIHLLDFGIATLIEDGGRLTQEYGRALTPQYASPEQLNGGVITVASDVYSLGLLLYELLTGRLPFDFEQKSLLAIQKIVLVYAPALASSRTKNDETAKTLRGDLDAILAKALAIELTKRYGSADAFADDLERYLAGQPVVAQPDTTWYKVSKALVRHRLAFAAGAVATVAIIIGAAVAVAQTHRANLENERSAEVLRFMFNLVQDAAPDELHPDAEITGKEIVAQGLERARHEFQGNPRLQGEIIGELARMESKLGDVASAEAAVKEANELLERLAPSDDPALNRTRVQLAENAYNDNDHETAKAKAKLAFDSCTQKTTSCAKARSYASGILSRIEVYTGEAERGIQYQKQAVIDAELGFGPNDVDVMMALTSLAIIQRNFGKVVDAMKSIERAAVIANELTLTAADRNDFLETKALIDLDTGNYDVARETFARLAGIASQPRSAERTRLRLLATALFELGLPAEAEAAASKAIDADPPSHAAVEILFCRQARARALSALGRHPEAKAEIEAVTHGFATVAAQPMTRQLLRARRAKAEILVRAGEYDAAAVELESLLALHATQPEVLSLEHARALDLSAALSRINADAPAARQTHQRAAEMLATFLPPTHPELEKSALYALLASDDSSEAWRAKFEKAARQYAKRFAPESLWSKTIDRFLESKSLELQQPRPPFIL